MALTRWAKYAWLAAFLLTANAQSSIPSISEVIDCYSFDGQTWQNNTRCPGSNACCGVQATCLSNRLCHNPDGEADVFVRGPCATKPWDKEGCAQICVYDEGDMFPRVKVCDDGSLCCDKDKTCCQNKRGVFLNDTGHVVSKKASGTVISYGTDRTASGYSATTLANAGPKTSSATTTASSGAVATAASSPVDDNGSSLPTGDTSGSSGGSDNKAAKIGAGVGVPLGVIAIGAVAGLFFMRRRRRNKGPAASELGTDGEKKVVYGGPAVTPSPQSSPAQELDAEANQVVHRSELPA